MYIIYCHPNKTMNYALLKITDDGSKHTVFGYIRRLQKLFSANIAYYHLPISVIHIILCYYYMSTFHGRFLNDKIVRKTKDDQGITCIFDKPIFNKI